MERYVFSLRKSSSKYFSYVVWYYKNLFSFTLQRHADPFIYCHLSVVSGLLQRLRIQLMEIHQIFKNAKSMKVFWWFTPSFISFQGIQLA